ncbi:MAG TPA: TolC family protein [Opitutaceae bacterium]|nr:TolC family protein [Opitutaceae bacterium]
MPISNFQILLVACVFTAATAASVRAESSGASPPLTVESAIAEALSQSPALKVTAAEIESAQGEVVSAQSRPPSELTFSPGVRRLRETEGAQHELIGSVEWSHTIVFPGKRELLVSIVERNVALRRLASDGLRFQVAAAVRKAFYELLAAQSVIEVRRQQLASAETFQQAAAKRVESGYASDFEAVKSQGDVINARKLLLGAEGNIAAGKIELNALLGREPSAPVEVAGNLAETDGNRPVPDLVALAITDNPSLKAQELQAEIAGLNVRKARLARKPDWTVGPSLELSRSEQILGLSASVPLPSKNYGRGEVMSATAEERKAQAERERLRREIVGAVTKAASQLDVARQQLAVYSPAYLDRLKTVVQEAEQSYARNATSLLIYLDAKRTYFDTLADYYQAIATVASNRAALESAVGVPLETKPSQL